MFENNMQNNAENDVGRIYDSFLLSGSFNELDEVPQDKLTKAITDAVQKQNESKSKKGIEKIHLQISALISYADALALNDNCEINNSEALLSFICVRHPELEFDWITLQKLISTASKDKIDFQDEKTLELAATIYISAIKLRLN